MKLTEFIKWVGANSERVVEDSGGLLRTDYPGVMAFDALRNRDRLTGDTERAAWSVLIPRHGGNAAEFFEPGFFADIIGIEKIYAHENREFTRFLWQAAEKQNTRLIALAFTEISPDKISELINKHGFTVDPFVGYWKYAKAFKIIEYIRGPGLPDTQRALTLLSRHADLWSDCTFCSRWIPNACREWAFGNKLSAESILFNMRQYIFAAAARKCFKDRALIPAAKMTLDKLGITYEPQFSV